ncbi:asparagine synthase (glutamine-hydrolyzing) [Tsukamurella sp. 8F]|uniref:asparagine synthase (glutamine-hydrolyzing) n=1 Tax=unclassified Tsukamurella TaxID=2633480 RepID=UPI0023BA1D21|nr:MULTISPECIES: asparagine synthase (glutamine-hydrolyzing) [unclassified Tsukamurella]MDF0532340.1 asparagine synthase (glutamine-hydrolyzing) [Tsukamurella sp. 8J]MDF0589458.1 asparagine synthase (glutamine-hydrolyzing) [Tsukamurella sp. 8F]
MCGIAGWVSFDRDLRSEGSIVDAMTGTMECRGPDARGTWLREHAALGHRRLAIVDLPGGKQPMTSAHAPVGLTYSGEAYNFTELRRELEGLGHRFATDSDTEVVLEGYLEWGIGVADRLNGMAAFAIWDEREQRLHLVRDRMGIKPLYFYPTPDGVLFGSEPKAILANPLARRVVTEDGLRELFGFVKTPGAAVWDGMYEVEPGTVVTVDRTGLRTHRYWELTTEEHPDDVDATVGRVRELLDDIVTRQLVADVPRCMLLSGGLDSSALTALAAQQLGAVGETVRSFAVDFLGQAENFVADDLRGTPDTPYVHDVAAHSRTEHRDIILDPAQLSDPAVRAAVVRARDLPAGLGDMDGSLYLLFKAIREHSTVALSGESADEVFGGYKQFFDPIARTADTYPWLANTAMGGPHMRADEALRPGLRAHLDLEGFQRASFAAAAREVQHLPGESETERQMRRMSYLHLTRFVRILLDRKDRASMAVGLEVRVPFCDHRLVEYVYNAPWEQKNFDGREKSLLRAATKDVLPQSVVDRVKSPYPSTQDLGYVRRLQSLAADVAASPDHSVFEIVDRDWLAAQARLDPADVTRAGLERALDLHTWIDIYNPTVKA